MRKRACNYTFYCTPSSAVQLSVDTKRIQTLYRRKSLIRFSWFSAWCLHVPMSRLSPWDVSWHIPTHRNASLQYLFSFPHCYPSKPYHTLNVIETVVLRLPYSLLAQDCSSNVFIFFLDKTTVSYVQRTWHLPIFFLRLLPITDPYRLIMERVMFRFILDNIHISHPPTQTLRAYLSIYILLSVLNVQCTLHVLLCLYILFWLYRWTHNIVQIWHALPETNSS